MTNDRENKKLWVSGGSRSGDHVEAEEKSVVEKSRRHVVINGTGVNMEKQLGIWRENGWMMWRKNKAEHSNGGEGLKEMWNLHMSEQGREDLEMGKDENSTLRRHNEPLP